jgi:small multidrug resistance pump
VGIVLVALVAWLWHKQTLDLPAIIGMALIIAGVLVMNLFSRSVTH